MDMTSDPNKERNDTMVPEYWNLGEDFQDQAIAAGYESESVEGIAVDIHDILQAADVIRAALESDAPHEEKTRTLLFELNHIRWHCEAATAFLQKPSGASQTPAGE
jgi:hypothetical protein